MPGKAVEVLETVFWVLLVLALVFLAFRVVLRYGRRIVGAIVYVAAGLLILYLIFAYRASFFEFVLGLFR